MATRPEQARCLIDATDRLIEAIAGTAAIILLLDQPTPSRRRRTKGRKP